MSIHLIKHYHKTIHLKDTDGNYRYIHMGGCIQNGDKYYWYGVKYKEADIYAKILNGKGNATM